MSSSLKSNQHYMSSANDSISINIRVFWGARFKKSPGAVGKWVRFQKKSGFPIYLAKGKNLTPRHVEIPKRPYNNLP